MNLRERARGQPCYARFEGICNEDSETVVLAHLRIGGVGGMGIKPADTAAFPACSSCHDAMDGRARTDSDLTRDMLRALVQWSDHCYRQGWIKETRR